MRRVVWTPMYVGGMLRRVGVGSGTPLACLVPLLLALPTLLPRRTGKAGQRAAAVRIFSGVMRERGWSASRTVEVVSFRDCWWRNSTGDFWICSEQGGSDLWVDKTTSRRHSE